VLKIKKIIKFKFEIRIFFLLFLFKFLFPSCLNSAVPLLIFPEGVQNIGMGETGALSYRNENILNNSASLIFSRPKKEISFSNLKWVDDTTYSNMYFSSKNWGLGLSFFDYGSFSYYGETPSLAGEFKAYDGMFFISRSFKTGDTTSLGISLKVFSEKIGEFNGSGVAFDFSFCKRIQDPFTKNLTSFYMGIKNIGGKIKLRDENESVDSIVEGGFGFALKRGGWFNILLSRVGDTLYLKAGIESFLSRVLRFRLGYVYPQEGNVSSLSGLRAGIGVNFNSFSINYALYPFQDVSYHHIFSVSFNLK